ncbi:hypothetical protein R6Q59_003588 [Mikania micrantha]
MGICTSCQSTYAVTGKLVLPDGRLQEFFQPTKASYFLHKNPNTFICDSDEMDFDDVVSPIKDDEELQPGQLYFVLPIKRLNLPLQPEEMAALAVKASAALAAKCGGCRRSKGISFTTSFSGEKRRVIDSARVAEVETVGLSRRSCGGGVGGGKGRKFKAMLAAIPE